MLLHACVDECLDMHVYIFSVDIRIEFWLREFGALVMTRGLIKRMDKATVEGGCKANTNDSHYVF